MDDIAYIIAQAIGILGMCGIIFSFQFKSKNAILISQCLGAAFFSVNMFMLGALSGGIINIVAVIRAIVYMKKDSFKKHIALVTAIFILLYFVSYALIFTVFKMEPTPKNLIVELLPVIGMIIMTFAFAGDDAKKIRVLGLVNSPCWLIYNLFNLSIGGILCETFSLISITSAFIRIDMKEMKEKKRGSDL